MNGSTKRNVENFEPREIIGQMEKRDCFPAHKMGDRTVLNRKCKILIQIVTKLSIYEDGVICETQGKVRVHN